MAVLICAAAGLPRTHAPGARLGIPMAAPMGAAMAVPPDGPTSLPNSSVRPPSVLPASILLLAGPALAELKQRYERPEGVPFPNDNPWSEAKEKLGRMLFFDPILSGGHTISCASCHNPSLSWADNQKLASGSGRMKLHTPTIIDVAWVPVLGWDGKFRSLESVAFGPLLNPDNMNNTEAEIVSRLTKIPGYVEAFSRAFPGVTHAGGPSGAVVTRPRIEQAIATFERTVLAAPAPFDRWIDGDENAIGVSAKRGFILFNDKAGCANCHEGPSLSDFSFHDIGLAKEDDIGRGRLFPTSVKLRHGFKVPTLRDVARRAPYMHDGSIPTLEAVVDAYDTGGVDRPSRSEFIHPLGLSLAEKQDLVAFLRTLTGDPAPFALPALPR
jgi:cytochrome c peroxidase